MNGSVPGLKYIKDNKPLWMTMACVAILTVGTFLTVLVFLGIYSYGNPDPNSCWVIKDMENTERTREAVIASATALGVEISEGYPMEIHRVFKTWFRWGFWASLVFLMLCCIIGPITAKTGSKVGMMLGWVNMGLFTSNSLVWIAFGAIWRFSKPGSVASGDKLERLYGTSDADWNQQMTAASEANGY